MALKGRKRGVLDFVPDFLPIIYLYSATYIEFKFTQNPLVLPVQLPFLHKKICTFDADLCVYRLKYYKYLIYTRIRAIKSNSFAFYSESGFTGIKVVSP